MIADYIIKRSFVESCELLISNDLFPPFASFKRKFVIMRDCSGSETKG